MFPNQNIYPYHTGTQLLYADPLVVYDKLMVLTEGRLNELIEKSNSEDTVVQATARQLLIKATYEVFSLQPFNPESGEGVVSETAMAVLRGYLEWMHEKKKREDGSLVSSPPTTSGPSPSPSPTKSLYRFASTSRDCGCGNQ